MNELLNELLTLIDQHVIRIQPYTLDDSKRPAIEARIDDWTRRARIADFKERVQHCYLCDRPKLDLRLRGDRMKEYLGDAVYAQVDCFGALVLTTEDGLRATNTIVLEPEVLVALMEYIERLRAPVSFCTTRSGATAMRCKCSLIAKYYGPRLHRARSGRRSRGYRICNVG